jgi:DNA-binding phage protein
MISQHITSTTLYLGTCPTCDRPYRIDLGDKGSQQRVMCPSNCGALLTVERLAAVTTEETCDSRCMGATGPNCSCACGGANHGRSWGTTATTYELESAVATLRARQERTERQREQRAAAKVSRKQRIFDAWAADNQDIVDYLNNLLGDYSSDFISDMADVIRAQKPLSERQAEVIRRIMAEGVQREAKKAAYDATKKPAPLGKGITVEGTIISLKKQETYYTYNGEVTWKMTVQCDGYRVYSTVPNSLIGNIISSTSYSDLKDQRVRFVAELVSSKGGDPSFVIAKRPKNAEKI